MSNSELATRVSGDAAGSDATGSDAAVSGAADVNLANATLGLLVAVTAIDPTCRAALVPEGLDVGVELTVERRLALGGPVIVRLGRTRLAVGRNLAAGVSVRAAAESGPAC